MKILLVDNFDSFTFNLVHYLESFNYEVHVFRNNAIPFELLYEFDRIILSPGPGLPNEAEGMMELIRVVSEKIPILGVCLGMQALAIYFGDNLINLAEVKHGVKEEIHVLEPSLIFQNLPQKFGVGLYHSWAVTLNSNSAFNPLAISESGVLMAISHKKLPLFGVQFHPESILTEFGKEIIENFIKIKKPIIE